MDPFEGMVIKQDEFDDYDTRNYSINSNKGTLISRTNSVRFTNLDGVNVVNTPEFNSLFDLGKEVVRKLADISSQGIVYIKITHKSITVEKESAIKWRNLQPQVLLAISCIFESSFNEVQVEDRTGKQCDFGVLAEFTR